MAFDEDCTGDGLISDWIWDPVAYNLEECSNAGGTYVYGRLATLEVRTLYLLLLLLLLLLL